MRFTFVSEDRVKQTVLGEGGPRPISGGPEHAERWSKGEFPLCQAALSEIVVFSCFQIRAGAGTCTSSLLGLHLAPCTRHSLAVCRVTGPDLLYQLSLCVYVLLILPLETLTNAVATN